ncbi:MAG: hypothetical protein ACFCUG_14070 [Thiotrichales bacterium]
MQSTIERLEARLLALNIDQLPEHKRETAREERRRIQAQLADLRLQQAESWQREDWLSGIERALDELGRKVTSALRY